MQMEEATYIVIFITTATAVEARNISQILLNQKKAACVNIVPEVNSLFWWRDKLDSARESLLIIKTKAALLPEIVSLVKEVHSYEIPEIIALPVIGGNQDYLKWLGESVTGEDK